MQERPAEVAKLKEEIEKIDEDIWVVLDNDQQKQLAKAEELQKNIIAIQGPPGSGKTLIAQG